MGKKRIAAILLSLCLLLSLFPAQAEPHTHVYGDWIVTLEPGCLSNGQRVKICTDGDSTISESIGALGHNFSDWGPGVAPTCFASGYVKRTCTRCGTMETLAVPKLDHQYGPWVAGDAATCFYAGFTMSTCALCGTVKTQAIPRLEHQFGPWTGVAAPTCRDRGYDERICSLCNSREARYHPALGHDFGAWLISPAPDCTKVGSQKRVCARCGQEEVQKLKALGHIYSPFTLTTAPTCTKKGVETSTCGRCGVTKTRSLKALGHKPDNVWVITQAATNQQQGTEAQHCTVCGQVTKSRKIGLPGYRYEVRTFAWGLEGGLISPGLKGHNVQLLCLDMTQEGRFSFPLVSKENYHVGTAWVEVQNGAVSVSLEKASDNNLLRYRSFKLFNKDDRIRFEDLKGTSQPFNQWVKVQGDEALLYIDMLATYYQGGYNKYFSAQTLSPDGENSYEDISNQMLELLGR